MLELTEQQWQSLEVPDDAPARLVNPLTKEKFVVVREAEYERLTDDGYDDSPGTMEEMHALAWEMFDSQPANMDDYDKLPDKT